MFKSKNGYFGKYGGKFIPEILQSAFDELQFHYQEIIKNNDFWDKYVDFLSNYSCRPTPVTCAYNLTSYLGGAKIYLKREDLNNSGSHKFNNVIGQGLLAKRMKKKRIIAETGAGQHGVATAIMSALLNFDCTIYMGKKDVERQYSNVFWMKKYGAKVVTVEYGSQSLKEAINEAFRDWSASVKDTYYVLGTACGPSPYPEMVAYFQSIIGKEAKQQLVKKESKLPSRIYACVGGGSNSLGIFSAFIDEKLDLVAVEAGGKGIETGKHATRMHNTDARLGTVQGYTTLFLQNEDGQMNHTHSIAAGLDYVGISPILAYYGDKRHIRFESATDKEVIEATRLLIQKEGIIPALETAHALVQMIKEVPILDKNEYVLVNISGRGDKDIFNIAEAFDDQGWKDFIFQRSQNYYKNNKK